MKSKIIFLLFLISLFSCEKEIQQPKIETNVVDFEKPIILQVEAVHDDGSVVKSPIWVVKY